MNKKLRKELAQISSTLAEGQGLLELNDFEDYEERVAEFELGFDALEKVKAYIKELENYCPEDDEEVVQNVLANKGLSDCY